MAIFSKKVTAPAVNVTEVQAAAGSSQVGQFLTYSVGGLEERAQSIPHGVRNPTHALPVTSSWPIPFEIFSIGAARFGRLLRAIQTVFRPRLRGSRPEVLRHWTNRARNGSALPNKFRSMAFQWIQRTLFNSCHQYPASCIRARAPPTLQFD